MSARQKQAPPSHVKRMVQNKSSRLGAPVLAVAVHSTESQDIPRSWDDLNGIYNYFNTPKSRASAHVGIDGEGHMEWWVPSNMKAWTILDLNSVTCNIEFVGRAAQAGRDWEEAQIKKGAATAAWWLLRYNLPAQRGVVRNIHGQAVVTKKGIITHKQLTDAGFGSHQDPGANFPMTDFTRYTQYYKKKGWVV